MQRAGEQQEAEHALQQRLGEVELLQRVGDPVVERHAGNEGIGHRQPDCPQRAHHGQPDDMRQLEEMMVEPAEQRGGDHEDRGDVEGGKRGAGGVMHPG